MYILLTNANNFIVGSLKQEEKDMSKLDHEARIYYQEDCNLDALKGKKIAVQIGTTSATEAKKLGSAEVKELNSSADTFIELNAKGVDAVINDRPVNDRYIVESKNDNVKVLSELLTSEDYGMAINKNNAELQTKINEALKKLKDNGKYDQIYAKWFGNKK